MSEIYPVRLVMPTIRCCRPSPASIAPYEDEARQLKKPHGLVVDFVGIFDKIEKALAFDSDEIDAIVKDVDVLKRLFGQKMKEAREQYLTLVSTGALDRPFTDKDTDTDSLIEHFRDKSRRGEFFKECDQIELLYEVISPDAYLSLYLDPYALLSKIYQIVRNAFGKRVVSCSTNGRLNFNNELLAFNEEVRDYIIIHKLVHLKVP